MDHKKPSLGWGRVFAAARLSQAPETRRGAWYPVVSEGRSRVVLEVNGKRVDLAKAAVEVRAKRPDKFTVVYRSANDQAPPVPKGTDPGRVYAVCPDCAKRTRLFGEPQTLQCPVCRHEGVIAWWETG
jgi:hypothetical protein